MAGDKTIHWRRVSKAEIQQQQGGDDVALDPGAGWENQGQRCQKTDQQTARVRKIRRFQVLRPGDIIYRVEQATDEEFCGAIDRYPNAVLPVGQRGEFQ